MDDKLKSAIEQFILQRVNDCGAKGSESLQGAYQHFMSCAKELKSTLTPEQKKLFLNLENAYIIVDGETQQCYYRAGFSDAVMFLMSWRDGDSLS